MAGRGIFFAFVELYIHMTGIVSSICGVLLDIYIDEWSIYYLGKFGGKYLIGLFIVGFMASRAPYPSGLDIYFA